jgi:carbamoyl-phosphate synthase large subunit
MPKNKNLSSILIIGSGPIVIGQACEFDYSGSQSLRSLREDGIETILINSNPATIMTDPSMADHVYLLPLTTKSIIQILKEHPQIDAVLATMGGQTALNLCIEADEKGIWKDFEVDLIGVDINAINITEDREQFRELMGRIGVAMAPQATATSFLRGKEIAQDFGFPLCIRSSFTLGGAGAAIVYEEKDFDKLLRRGLEISPIHEVMIDKAMMGWKEYELELLRARTGKELQNQRKEMLHKEEH